MRARRPPGERAVGDLPQRQGHHPVRDLLLVLHPDVGLELAGDDGDAGGVVLHGLHVRVVLVLVGNGERQVQVFPDVHVRRGPVALRRRGHGVVAEHGQRLLQGDLRLEPGQRRAEAAVHALAEPEVTEPPAGHVEPVWIGEAALVTVGGAVDQHHPTAGRDGHPVQRDLAGRGAADQLQRGGQADRLLHGVRDERRLLPQQRALVRVLGEQLEQRPGEPGGALHPAEEQHHHQAEDLRGGPEVLLGERHAFDLRGDDVGHQVRARPGAPLVQQVDEVGLDAGGGRLGHRGEAGVVGLTVLELMHPLVQLRAAFLPGGGQAEQVEEHLVGHRPGQLLGQVHGAPVPPGVDEAAHHRADRVFAFGDAVGQQLRLDHPADLVMTRVVDVRQEPGAALVLRGVVDVDALVADGTSAGPSRPPARPRTGTAPTSSTSRCRTLEPRRASSGTPGTGRPGTPG